jgi:hypothetical protein
MSKQLQLDGKQKMICKVQSIIPYEYGHHIIAISLGNIVLTLPQNVSTKDKRITTSHREKASYMFCSTFDFIQGIITAYAYTPQRELVYPSMLL